MASTTATGRELREGKLERFIGFLLVTVSPYHLGGELVGQ
jgi:hypothetical protein